MTVEYRVGDVFQRMAEIPDGSIDLVLTSPPFLALRSYLPADHPHKAKEIGSEPTPAAFIDTLLRLTAEWRRVLAPHGSIAVELGDTYSGSGGGGGDYSAEGLRSGQPTFDGSGKRVRETRREGFIVNGIDPPARRDTSVGWPLAKSLTGIPTLYAWSLAYGRNLLTGEPSPAGQWRVRNLVAWCRPNPPVGALGDKFRPGTSYITIACVSAKRFFDLDAVRTEHRPHWFTSEKPARVTGSRRDDGVPFVHQGHPVGAPPLDWWEIPTQPYKGSHYATFPEALLERPIKAMVPTRVCTVCGKPSERITEASYTPHGERREEAKSVRGMGVQNGEHAQAFEHGRATKNVETLGFTDCGHDAWRNGIVLDPFAGSGTTLQVAQGLGRDAIGIDIDSRNADLARERVGMFLLEDDGVAS